METNHSFATCASSSSWTTVIENPSNVKEIWNGIQTYTIYVLMDMSGSGRHGVVYKLGCVGVYLYT